MPLFVKKSPFVRDKKYQGVSLNFLIDTFSVDKEAEHTRTEAMEVETRLKQFYFEKYLLDVASTTLERGGVTTNVATWILQRLLLAWRQQSRRHSNAANRMGERLSHSTISNTSKLFIYASQLSSSSKNEEVMQIFQKKYIFVSYKK